LENAFIVNPKYNENNEIMNNKILLFDDVYTTGTTIKQARKVLENTGFKNVYSLTIAR
jgi:competence protein ComFC